jgi:hypothetical protein
MQQAMQWWDEQQALQFNTQATKIRDRLLQDLFAARRSLELIPTDSIRTSLSNHQNYLATIETLHQQFEEISNYLAPPYLEESLPLAIQHRIERWKTQYPMVNIELDVPAHWNGKPSERHRILLRTLDEFLRLSISHVPNLEALHICLSIQGSKHLLTIQIPYAHPSSIIPLIELREIKYLEHAFQLLMPGYYQHQKTETDVTWSFYWHPQPAPNYKEESNDSTKGTSHEPESV